MTEDATTSKLLAALLGFLGGSLASLLKPWLDEKGKQIRHRIKTNHERWIFVSGAFDTEQTSGIALTPGKWGPRRYDGNWSWSGECDQKNYNLTLENRGELFDLEARGMIGIRENQIHLTNAGWIEFERIKAMFLNPKTSPLRELLTPVQGGDN